MITIILLLIARKVRLKYDEMRVTTRSNRIYSSEKNKMIIKIHV